MAQPPPIALADVEAWLHRLFVAASGTELRKEDRQKARELVGVLTECRIALDGTARNRTPVVVDAASGKSAAGLLLGPLVMAPARRAIQLHVIDRDPARITAGRTAVSRLQDAQIGAGPTALGGLGDAPTADAAAAATPGLPPAPPSLAVQFHLADVADPTAWPPEPDLAVALHACGAATDSVIDAAIAARARTILVVPCCVGRGVAAAATADTCAETTGIPRHGEIRHRFVETFVMAERTLRLEAAGYETVAVAFAPPTVTPYNLALRARRVGEPGRMAEAAARRGRLLGAGVTSGTR